MPWRTYTGSSSHLNEQIKQSGHDKFSYEIIDLYKTKGGLYYSEAWCQMVSECMTEMLPDNKTPRFYNRQIAAIRFVPREGPTDKTRRYVKQLTKRY